MRLRGCEIHSTQLHLTWYKIKLTPFYEDCKLPIKIKSLDILFCLLPKSLPPLPLNTLNTPNAQIDKGKKTKKKGMSCPRRTRCPHQFPKPSVQYPVPKVQKENSSTAQSYKRKEKRKGFFKKKKKKGKRIVKTPSTLPERQHLHPTP